MKEHKIRNIIESVLLFSSYIAIVSVKYSDLSMGVLNYMVYFIKIFILL